ncbi:MAG: SAM-dependent methyltransferase [bacterium]|nr:SAM-dependent methyltransferase [bacterium]
MEQLSTVLEECMSEQLGQVILSNSKEKEKISKVKIRPVMLKNRLFFQCTSYVGTKVLHENHTKEGAIRYILEYFGQTFKQIEMTMPGMQITGLASKRGNIMLKKKKLVQYENQAGITDLSHNRKKKYLIEEGTYVPFMEDLGVMNKDGKIIRAKYDKYKQINRFLEFIEDIVPRLPADRRVQIIDFGCGKSYLTFAMYYYLKIVRKYDVCIVGLDLKEDVIEHCNQLKDQYGYDQLSFVCGDISTYNEVNQVDMVVTLHACDTATDYALAKAVKWNASVILSVPCCQHELNGQIQNDLLSPVLKYGLLKERMSALITDGIRANLLEQNGYEVQVLEFIDMQHTPKNILIRAVRTGQTDRKDEKTQHMISELHAKPMLEELLRDHRQKE